jgi:four helix bundle protein
MTESAATAVSCDDYFGNTNMGDFKRLVAWQQANAYVMAVHAAFAGRKADAATGSRAQVLRAVSSIPDALAEGCAKRSREELARYADIAYGSAKEVESQLIKARDLGILSATEADDLLRLGDRVSKLCYGLSRSPHPAGPHRGPPVTPGPMSDIRQSDVRFPLAAAPSTVPDPSVADNS